MYTRSKCVYAFLTAALIATSAFGQDAPAPAQAPAPAAAPAAPPPPPWSIGGIDFSGLIDGYYTWNPNHPASGNGLYNFDTNANQFSLNMLKLSMSHAVDPIGFQVDFGYGHAFEIIHATDTTAVEHLEQAYVSWKPQGKDKNLQLDFGEFVTSAGAEVIESNGNWNYSRSLLFAWAIPYYHFGLRASDTWGHFTGGFQLVNGWNNIKDNNSGKTMGFVGNFTGKKMAWNNNFYTGPENPNTNTGWRNLYDTTVLFTPADKFNAYVNFDYGSNNCGTKGALCPTLQGTGTNAKWYGIAFAAKFQMNDKNALTPRYEWFKDKNGFETGMVCAAGKDCDALQEFTLTYEYKWTKGLLARLEYRRDWTTLPQPGLFQRGSTGASDHQDTLALGVVAFFGPK